jgi:hypothetical protein
MRHSNLVLTPWSFQRFLKGFDVTYVELEEAEFFAMRWLYDGGHAGIRFREIGKDSIEELWVKGELSDLPEEKYKFFSNKRVPRLWRENAMSGFVNIAADKLRGMDDFMTETRMPPRYTNYHLKRTREEKIIRSPQKRLKNEESVPARSDCRRR